MEVNLTWTLRQFFSNKYKTILFCTWEHLLQTLFQKQSSTKYLLLETFVTLVLKKLIIFHQHLWKRNLSYSIERKLWKDTIMVTLNRIFGATNETLKENLRCFLIQMVSRNLWIWCTLTWSKLILSRKEANSSSKYLMITQGLNCLLCAPFKWQLLIDGTRWGGTFL